MPIFSTLIDPEVLASNLGGSDWIVVDCRFDLVDTAAGRQSYLENHIPGAVYAHLDEELSAPISPTSGRHPMPRPEEMNLLFGRLGVSNSSQVVVYDESNGAVASRLWWMLHYMGHDAAAVLDGGWQAWLAAGLPVRNGLEQNTAKPYSGIPRLDWLADANQVERAGLVVDSRSPDRYRGEIEPIDAVAGHIPGAVNFFYGENVGQSGRYLPADDLRRRFEVLLSGKPAEEAVFYCGSGVTACANLLALAHAGLGRARLYGGSWSEWIRDPNRPVATG